MWPFPPFNPPLRDWRGRSVWLVGASSGIGAALALALSALGARVTISARREAVLHEVAQQAQSPMRVLALDATDAQAVAQAAAQVQAEQGLDVVVYAAGHYQAQRAPDIDLVECERHWRINVWGAQALGAAVLPVLMAQGHGHWSVVSSIAGHRGLPRALAYGSSKAALTHWMEALVFDLRPRGVGLSVVHPGFVRTPMTAVNDFEMPALISPEEAAQAILRDWARGCFDVHFPKRFTWVVKALRHLPDRLYFYLVKKTTDRP
jgi:NAD(P)-dependent dehydrogenase (short-subunit alcohol dehydrogenase family)